MKFKKTILAAISICSLMLGILFSMPFSSSPTAIASTAEKAPEKSAVKLTEKPAEHSAQSAQAKEAHSPDAAKTGHGAETSHATELSKTETGKAEDTAAHSESASNHSESDAVSSSEDPKIDGIPSKKSVDDFVQRKRDIEKRSKELEEKEAELAARDRALQEEMAKLDELRKDIKKNTEQKSVQDEEKISRLVEVLQNMTPKNVAQILVNVDLGLAVSAMTKVDAVKLSKILNALEPEKSSKLIEALAGVSTAKVAEVKQKMEGSKNLDPRPDTGTAHANDGSGGGDDGSQRRLATESETSGNAARQKVGSEVESASGPSQPLKR